MWRYHGASKIVHQRNVKGTKFEGVEALMQKGIWSGHV